MNLESKILVTGATGFVGQAVTKRLWSSGRPFKLVGRRSETAACSINAINGATDWAQHLHDVDSVIHLAACVHATREEVPDLLAAFRAVNVDGTRRLAQEAAAAGVRRLVFVSSVKVNGVCTGPGQAFTAKDTPMPLDAYGCSKWEAEQALHAVAAGSALEVVIVRPPLVYGPRVKANFLRLLQWIERGLPLPFANLENRRSLVNIGNLVDLIVRCIQHPAAAGETFLVSDGEDISTADLVRHLGAAMGRKPRLFPVPLSLSRSVLKAMGKEDLWQRLFGSLQVRCDKAKNLLGWNPPVSMAEGLEEVGRWYVESKSSR